jgi:hypothetical protein
MTLNGDGTDCCLCSLTLFCKIELFYHKVFKETHEASRPNIEMNISLYKCNSCHVAILPYTMSWRCRDKTYCSEHCIHNLPACAPPPPEPKIQVPDAYESIIVYAFIIGLIILGVAIHDT